MTLAITRVAPIGEQVGEALVCGFDGCGLEEVAVPVYPPSPMGRKLRDLRLALGLNLRAAAARLGISASDLSALERGSATCAWAEAERMLADRA